MLWKWSDFSELLFQEPIREDLRKVKIEIFHGGSCPWTPIEACTLVNVVLEIDHRLS